mmetsp:Transcript_98989/g.268853  ORF Transcript_98989/g.268853 Transcript_98989/m.268853 type:complete len:243 (+) Transcript_98989:72-800(+)
MSCVSWTFAPLWPTHGYWLGLSPAPENFAYWVAFRRIKVAAMWFAMYNTITNFILIHNMVQQWGDISHIGGLMRIIHLLSHVVLCSVGWVSSISIAFARSPSLYYSWFPTRFISYIVCVIFHDLAYEVSRTTLMMRMLVATVFFVLEPVAFHGQCSFALVSFFGLAFVPSIACVLSNGLYWQLHPLSCAIFLNVGHTIVLTLVLICATALISKNTHLLPSQLDTPRALVIVAFFCACVELSS